MRLIGACSTGEAVRQLPGNDAIGGRIRKKMSMQSGRGMVSGLCSMRHPEIRVDSEQWTSESGVGSLAT